ncbi:hypothetical protein [Acinetobacter sp. MD2(2019)]|uniref:hypothetical protein n=1 Tax=Acinetobacter sp. MD2(2019) TaxID=2605273 RepID=UPI002D1EAAC6|nr:hypothetical protein [Acinetobacter sp. MD2(2019)]MEB3753066.1 hypothetical protein [Acinetobacter sp. MD2(2019)]
MLIYIIPFVLLLVVAIVLKKRESNQQNSTAKKTQTLPGKNKAKRVKGKTAPLATTVSETQDTQDNTVEETPIQPIAINPEFKTRIEGLIAQKNFGTAEALINQELNQNPKQHDLYLFLADIHIEQQDTFALDQLRSHLRALQLLDIVQYIENALQKEKDKRDAIQYTPMELPNTQAPFEKSTAQNESASIATENSFDQLSASSVSSIDSAHVVEEDSLSTHAELNSVRSDEVDNATTSTQASTALEFDLDLSSFNQQSPVIEAVPSVETDVKPLEFSFSLEPTSIESKGASSTTPKADIGNNLDLNLDFDQSIQLEHVSTETKTEQLQTSTLLDHSFSALKLEPATTETQITALESPSESPALDFKFDFEAVPATSVEIDKTEITTAENTQSFSFDFSPTTTPVEEVKVESEVANSNILDFTFDAKQVAVTPEPIIDLVQQQPIEHDDPILQQFPELAQMQETELDLLLAEQYIKLGANAAASELLSAAQTTFDATQTEQAKKLLNQIAS